MTTTEAIRWFKHTFYQELGESVSGTLFSIDQLCAIAFQETGYIWRNLTGGHPAKPIFTYCVGDTLDTPNRSAFA